MARAKKVPDTVQSDVPTTEPGAQEQWLDISMEEANTILDKLGKDIPEIPNDTDSLKMKVLLALIGNAELYRCPPETVHSRTVRILEVAEQVTQLIKGEV